MSDMEYSAIVRIDSVRLVDSVHINTYSHGDTVYHEEIKVVYRDRVKTIHDTVYIIKNETIKTPIPTEREPSIWERIGGMLNEARWLIITAVVAYFAFRIFKRKTPPKN
jgi:hypothetical protein